MSANNQLIITFNSEGMQVNITQNTDSAKNEPTNLPSETIADDGGDIVLCSDKGIRIDFIRTVYSLCQLGFFMKKQGGKAADIQVFKKLGNAFGIDLTRYSNDLNRSLQDSSALEKHTRIFDEMSEVMRNKFNSM